MSETRKTTGGTHATSGKISRREVLKGAATVAGLMALGTFEGIASPDLGISAAASMLPPPASSGIEHIVVCMMENRSFDHFFGWLPGADGQQAGLTFKDQATVSHSTYHLTDFQSCGKQDPDHSQGGGIIQFNNGGCDGWLLTSPDTFPIGYYTSTDLPFYRAALERYTTFDRYFCAILAETYPNRFYQHSGRTDRIHNGTNGSGPGGTSTLPTIWDNLAAHNVSAGYYYNDLPFLALFGQKYLSISKPFNAFITDCASGTLPQVAYVDPAFGGEGQGVSRDDHPFADIRNGQAFLYSVYKAVTQSPLWPKTVLVINYDEWGGFFDHVPPAIARDGGGNVITYTLPDGQDNGMRGFRVPCLLISPWSRPGFISHNLYDHTSVLRMIEWRFNLPSLTFRDATASNIAEALDFNSPPNPTAFEFDVPSGPFGMTCAPVGPAAASHLSDLDNLRTIAQMHGWPVI